MGGAVVVEVDGAAATLEEVLPALSGYWHFTAMQVRGGAVRGLAYHGERLDAASRELFGTALSMERVRGCVRHALDTAGAADASVRVHVYQPVEERGGPVAVMVTVRPPADMPPGPYRVKSVPYLRPAAHLKHGGGFGQGWFLRQVEAQGCQEALLTGPGGEIAEGAITNIGFVEGDALVWPATPHLRGIALQVLEDAFDAAGIPWSTRVVRLADVAGFDGAFVCNSRGIATVAEIDGTPLPTDGEVLRRVARSHEAVAWDPV